VDDGAIGERVGRVEGLLGELEALADPVARDTATETVQAVLELYGEGLERILARADASMLDELVDDELVSHLLLLHDLHPIGVEDRVRGALAEVRPYLESHGGNVELVGVQDGVATLRMQGSCEGCPASAATLELAIEEAVRRAAPDIERIEAAGVPEAPPPLIQLEMSPALREPDPPAGAWAVAGSFPDLSSGGAVVKRVAGEDVLFARLDGTFYAYRPGCPSCGEPIDGSALEGGELACPNCAHRYDVRRAGRSLDEPDRYLDPVPLLLDDVGLVKVALGSRAA
jgi:Fe-S cluster biogenesis protein NfuA/nitrite reductase/ring-hydroxylating ferredoxin subunit